MRRSGTHGARMSVGLMRFAIAARLSLVVLALAPAAHAATAISPEIRMHAANTVPACVTPERLMAFLKERNPRLDARFSDIARWYKHYGEGWRVRWDYAFFQMAIETNFLTFRRPDGRMGDVDPRQNNFAGIGTTGGGVPGDRFPDVKTGVLAQIQHLVAYSGERLAEPVAPRTRLKQDHIIQASAALGRPVRFSDLARRWAVDPKYGTSIAWVAEQFRTRYCQEPSARQAPKWKPAPAAVRAAAVPPPSSSATAKPATGHSAPNQAPTLAARPTPSLQALPVDVAPRASNSASAQPGNAPRCQIRSARYGGRKAVLIRAERGDTIELTALTVLEGFERSMTDRFIAEHAQGGASIGEFHDEEAALTRAREVCPAA